MSFLDELNDVQREAAECVNGPLLILAGPGSGKTRVLMYRIAHLLSLGVPPWKILSLTFTNKAATEMKERIAKIVGEKSSQLWMGTFHSIFARILRVEAEIIGFGRNYTIYDSADSQNLIRTIMGRLGIPVQQFSPSAVHSRISAAKNSLVGPAEYEASAADFFAEKTARVYGEYERLLKLNNAMDFDDLLVRPIQLFTENPRILEKYRDRFHFAMVDEYQDTNRAQYVMLRLLVEKRRNICVVGDDAQSIYSFRGADIRNILEFEKDFPEATVIRLEQNYRSTSTILDAADRVIKHNNSQLNKTLWTENPAGDPIGVLSCPGDREEAAAVVSKIFSGTRDGTLSFRDFAVMYRTNAQSRTLEDSLRRNAVPYRLVGGVEFYQRREIKDTLAYLKVIVNPADSESVSRVINVPARGVGKTSLGRLRAFADNKGVGLFEAASRSGEIGGLSGRAVKGIESFVRLITDHRRILNQVSAGEMARALIDRLGILTSLKGEGTPDAQSRWENIQELLSALTEYSGSRPDPTLENFLQEVSLLTSTDLSDDTDNAVTLMTLHAAKGLEFPVVFITGMEEGILPLYGAGEPSAEDLEEERRLCYVGMTRAKSKLYCSHALVRHRFGEYLSQVRSRFLQEIPAESCEVEETGGDTPGLFTGAGGRSGRGTRRTRSGDRREWDHTDPEVDIRGFTSDLPELKKGMNVEHVQFGRGSIIRIEYAGEFSKVVVDFESFGRKNLILKYAGLKII